jgi:hypothetical protein
MWRGRGAWRLWRGLGALRASRSIKIIGRIGSIGLDSGLRGRSTGKGGRSGIGAVS